MCLPACGAYTGLLPQECHVHGPSPRVRGLHLHTAGHIRRRGSIPARAGPTRRAWSNRPLPRVHPRACGAYTHCAGILAARRRCENHFGTPHRTDRAPDRAELPNPTVDHRHIGIEAIVSALGAVGTVRDTIAAPPNSARELAPPRGAGLPTRPECGARISRENHGHPTRECDPNLPRATASDVILVLWGRHR